MLRYEAPCFPGPLTSLVNVAGGFQGNPVLKYNECNIFSSLFSPLFSRSQRSQYCPRILL